MVNRMWNSTSGSAKGTTSSALREWSGQSDHDAVHMAWAQRRYHLFQVLTTSPSTAVLAGLLPLFRFF